MLDREILCIISDGAHARIGGNVKKEYLGNAVTFWYALTPSNHATKHRNFFK
jgi:hypothetical protein